MPASKFIDFRTVKQSVSMEQILEHYGLLAQRLYRWFLHSLDELEGPRNTAMKFCILNRLR